LRKLGRSKSCFEKVRLIYSACSKFKITIDEAKESLKWEISRISTVNHPNLVQFYGIYQHLYEDYTYKVMELCSKGTLDDILKKGNVSWSKRWMWSLQITEALSYLHDVGVIHRDLKTENVLIDSEERAKLADFGVSQVDVLLESNEATIVTKGLQDKRFIAPENIQSNYCSKKTDIYALGLVFWQISSCSMSNYLKADKYHAWINGNLIEREPIPLDCPESFKKFNSQMLGIFSSETSHC